MEAVVPRLIYDPGIPDTDLLEGLLAAVGYKQGNVRSITQGELVVGSYKQKLEKILFDTGALHRSYVSKELVDRNRDKWYSSIVLARSVVRLADQRTTLESTEELKGQVVIVGTDGVKQTAERGVVDAWTGRDHRTT